MKRNLRPKHGPTTSSRVLETINNSVVAAAMLACTLLAFGGNPPPAVASGTAVPGAVMALEGLVVTPRGNYGAKAWEARQLARLSDPRLVQARPLPQRQCTLPAPSARPRTQTC
jgi:hypothetical protein